MLGPSVSPKRLPRPDTPPETYQRIATHWLTSISSFLAFLIDLGMAVVGWLMFGDGVRDEITKNIVITKGYPEWMTYFIVICIAIIPITKVPLNSRPIISTLEIALGLDSRAVADSGAMTGLSGATRGILKVVVRISTIVVFVILAILIPDFDRIMCKCISPTMP